MGLEFLDVTAQAHVSLINAPGHEGGPQRAVYRITNNGTSIIDTHLLLVASGLPRQIRMDNASGSTSTAEPYLRVFLPSGGLLPGQSVVETLVFTRHGRDAPLRYGLILLSGQGNP